VTGGQDDRLLVKEMRWTSEQSFWQRRLVARIPSVVPGPGWRRAGRPVVALAGGKRGEARAGTSNARAERAAARSEGV
jgi:hypothetical protein